MGKMSKDKGARFERELANIFKTEYGYTEAERTAQHAGKTGGEPDVRGLPGIHIEAKHQEKMRLYDWVDQAKRDVADKESSDLPAVFHRQNYKEILVTLPLDAFMQIYREYESGLELKKKEV